MGPIVCTIGGDAENATQENAGLENAGNDIVWKTMY